MKILVCVKRVPDTTAPVKIATATKIAPSEGEYILNPYDEIAIEHAMRIKEKNAGTEVIILTLGTDSSEKNIRSALAMGADRAILLEGNPETLEDFAIAQSLAEAIQNEKPDIVLTGIKAVDNDNAQVGAMVATLLDMPFMSTVVSMEVTNNKVMAESEIESGTLVLESDFPCVISIQKSNVEPRICSLINIRKAKSKEIKKIPANLKQEEHWQIVNVALPAERKGGKIVGQGPDAVGKLLELLHNEAKIL